jgi:AI-2 transport protein TqsA
MHTHKADSKNIFITIIGLTVVGIILRELNHIFIPLVIAYFLFFIFSPLNAWLEEKKAPSFTVILIDLLITVFVIWIISKVVIDSFLNFSNSLPMYAEKLSEIVSRTAISIGVTDPYFTEFSIQEMIQNIDYGILAGGIFSSTFSLLGSVFFILFFFVFVFTGHATIYEAIKKRYVVKKVKPELKKIKRELKTSVEDEQIYQEKIVTERQAKEETLENTFKRITGQIQRYIITKLIINLAAGLTVTGAMYLFGIEYPIIWGVFTFLFNFIPSIGSAIALVLPSIMALVQFDSIGYAIAIVVCLAVIQTIYFNLLEPMILGRSLNLNPLVILFSVLVWGYIWGIVGMLIAVPLTAIIKIILSNSPSQNSKFICDFMSQE